MVRLFKILIACIFGLFGVELRALFMPYLTESLGMSEVTATVLMIAVFWIAIIFIGIMMVRD